MKKLFSIVLMGAALLVSTNVSALDLQGLKDALNEGIDKEITLDQDIHLTTADSLRIKDGQTVTIDLNGFSIIRDKNTSASKNSKCHVFYLYHGTLNLTGKGSIVNLGDVHTGYATVIKNYKNATYTHADSIANAVTNDGTDARYPLGVKTWIKATSVKTGHYEVAGDASCVYMVGSKTPVANYSVLKVGKDVILNNADGKAGVNIYVSNSAIDKQFAPATLDADQTYIAKAADGKTNRHAAFGVVVNISGTIISYQYGVQVSGLIGRPVDEAHEKYAPTINLLAGSKVEVDASWPECTGIYCAGYGNWTMQGEVKGNVGVYVKSGNVDINGATIVSTNTEEFTSVVAKGSGIGAQGSAIVIESNQTYAGGMNVLIEGDTKVEAGSGRAIDELVTTAKEEELEDLTIKGGTFIGSEEQGCIIISSEAVKDELVTIGGGSYSNDTTITKLLDEDAFTTKTVDKEGNDIFVVTTGREKPEVAADINAAEDNTSVELNNGGEQTLTGDKTFDFLRVMGTNDVVIIPEGKKLTVGQLVMSADAQIIVRAGGSLIVTGDQGVVASYTDNIKIESQEGKMAKFLFSPAVTSNPNPKATVEFTSKSYYKSATDRRNQRMGLPMKGELEGITAKKGAANVPTVMSGYWNGSWTDSIVYINYPGKTPDLAKLNHPFIYYQMLNYAQTPGTVVTMQGSLVGNENPTLEVAEGGYATFANSYLGDMNAENMLDMFDDTEMEHVVYSYIPTGANTFAWEPFNFSSIEMGDLVNVEPMQAFIVKNEGAATNLTFNYKHTVWDPVFAPKAPRRAMVDANFAKMSVTNGLMKQGSVSVLEGDQFTAEYEAGYDAEKIMSNNVDLYVSGEQNLAILATDNMHNTFLGFNCVEAGEYTINFDKANGNGMVLVDLVKGTQIAMIEGNSYTFEAQANEANSHRFQIRKIAEQATALENVEAAKAEGIYTIMGQYVGKNINVLPAGVYVVNGAKIVK